MRESSNGRRDLPAWSDAPAATPYDPGDRVCGALDGYPGCVVSVDASARTVTVIWHGEWDAVVYPEDTIMIRRAMPWE